MILILVRIGNYGPVIYYINLEPSHNNGLFFFRSVKGTVWNRHGHHGAPRNIEIQHISPIPSIAHNNSFGHRDSLNLGHRDSLNLGHRDSLNQQDILNASITSSEVPSRTSSVSNVRHSFSESSKGPTDGPYLTQERPLRPKPSPKKTSQVTPRYIGYSSLSIKLQVLLKD